jgi:hypothetical protein
VKLSQRLAGYTRWWHLGSTEETNAGIDLISNGELSGNRIGCSTHCVQPIPLPRRLVARARIDESPDVFTYNDRCYREKGDALAKDLLIEFMSDVLRHRVVLD